MAINSIAGHSDYLANLTSRATAGTPTVLSATVEGRATTIVSPLSGGTGFLATLQGSGNVQTTVFTPATATAGGTQPFDAPGLDSLVASFKNSISALVATPLEAPQTDTWLWLNGGSPTFPADIAQAVDQFGSDVVGYLQSLKHNSEVEGNVVANAARAQIAQVSWAVTKTYAIDTGVLDPSSGGVDTIRFVTSGSLGFAYSDDGITFDGGAFETAYAQDPAATVATFNAVVLGVDEALSAHDHPWR